MAKLAIFLVGALFGAIGVFGWAIYSEANKPVRRDDLIFAAKNFYDTKENGELGFLTISGTLTGPDIAYPNNTYAISCYGRHKACFVSSVDQIGAEQIGSMASAADYPIIKWTDFEVVAQEEVSPFGCLRVTITIDRKREQVLWLEEPVNQSEPNCKNAGTGIRKFTIEDSPNWKRIMGK